MQRILALLIKIFHDPKRTDRSIEEQEKLLRKLKGTIGQFTTENRIYDTTFIFKGQDIRQTIIEEQEKLIELNRSASPKSPASPTSSHSALSAGGRTNKVDKQIKDLLKSEAKYERALGVPKDEQLQVTRLDNIAANKYPVGGMI